MDQPIYRINAGVGFAIDGLNLVISAEKSDIFSVSDMRQIPLSPAYTEKIRSLLQIAKAEYDIDSCISITIESGPANHSGFGVGTALSLSVLEAYLILFDVDYIDEDLIRLSGRGGTSGIGIHTYFHGGFIFDGGRKGTLHTHQPSSSVQNDHSNIYRPAIISSIPLPNWGMAVFLPENGEAIHGIEENIFFEKTCPISHAEASSAVYHAIIGTLCSVAEQDLSLFTKSINNLQNTKWKAEEIKRQGPQQKHLIQELGKICSGIGMSSLGPAMLLVDHDIDSSLEKIKSANLRGHAIRISANNHGRKISNA